MQIIMMHYHPPYKPTGLIGFFLSFSGVHNGRVLSTDVGGSEVDVRGPNRDFEAEQPDGD